MAAFVMSGKKDFIRFCGLRDQTTERGNLHEAKRAGGEGSASKRSPGARAIREPGRKEAGEKEAAGGMEKTGKPLETGGRKAIGTKAPKGSERGERIRKIRKEAKSAWPLIIKSKPLETEGRKARGLR